MKTSLTKRELEVLQKMKENELLTYSKGSGWWIGEEKTSGRLAMSLLRNCLISEDSFCAGRDNYVNYYINETGESALDFGECDSFLKILMK